MWVMCKKERERKDRKDRLLRFCRVWLSSGNKQAPPRHNINDGHVAWAALARSYTVYVFSPLLPPRSSILVRDICMLEHL